MLREALAIFHGNELIIGLFLGIWMGLTATGAFLAVQSSKFKVQRMLSKTKSTIDHRPSTIEYNIPLSLISILPLFTLFLLVTLRYSLVPYGIMPGLGMTALVIFLALLPFCLVSGMLFPGMVQSLSALTGKNLLPEGYALESAGSIIGGLLFSLVFILIFPPYESLVLLSSFSLLIISLLSFILKRLVRAALTLILSSLVFLMPTVPEIAKFLDQKQFNKQDVIEIKSSPVGMLAVSKTDGQIFIYENGVPVSLGEDVISREESVHYALLMHPSPDKVLIISGAASGSIEEALKYSPSTIDYVDRNPWLLRMIGKFRTLPQDSHVSYFYEDARIFLQKSDKKYDVILVNISEPESAEMNRYYTVEFYKLLKNKLNPGGIISVSTPAAGNYMNETSRLVHSVIFNTLKSVFSQVRIIPGAEDYFLASDSLLEQSIFNNYDSSGIKNDYVNPFYINETLLKMRSDLIMKDIHPDTQINSDLKPYVFSLFLKQWMERFKITPWLISLILLLLLILSLIFLGPLNLGLFSGGFTASGLEFILLIWFQVIYGYVYQMTGAIFALFMAGLVLGSWILGSRLKQKTFKGFLMIQGIFAVFAALIAALLFLSSPSPPPPFPAPMPQSMLMPLILVLVFLTGLLTGTQFSYSAHLRKTSIIKSSGESFSADLLGSAIGILLVSVYLVPQLGLPMTGMVLAGLNVVALGVVAWKGR
jgi:spermidine synthase